MPMPRPGLPVSSLVMIQLPFCGVIVFAAQPAENAQEISAAVMLLVNSRMGLFN
ncbi:hypothetical protein D3C72_2513350 [compost metagenome]